MTAAAAELVEALARRLLPAGIDLGHPLRARGDGDAVPRESRLPDVGPADAPGVVLASTSAFWVPFVRHLGTTPGALDEELPIEACVTGVVHEALAELPLRHRV